MATPNVRLRERREATPSRAVPGERMGRAELAEAVNAYLWVTRRKRYSLDAHTIARYERGSITWPSAAYRTALRAVLGVRTDAELGFRPSARGRGSSNVTLAFAPIDLAGDIDLGVSRAEFLERTSVETPVPTRVGWTDVEHVRATTRAVAMSENLFGGGLSCEAAAAHLRWASRLLDAQAAADVRCAMHEAVGNLSGVVAFSAFDIAHYDAADRCFQFALWCADRGESWALRANTLAEMSRKAAYLGDLDGALSLIEFAQVRTDRVTATARAMLWAIRSRLLALVGRHTEARSDIERADAEFAARDTESDPPWLCYYDSAEHQGSTGKALIPVAREAGTPDLAATRLMTAVRLHDSKYPRSRAFSRTRLAGLLMTTGDPHEAVEIGRLALQDAAPLRSRRIVNELRALASAAEPHAEISDVAELRADITLLAAAGV